MRLCAVLAAAVLLAGARPGAAEQGPGALAQLAAAAGTSPLPKLSLPPKTAAIVVKLFDGTRRPLPAGTRVLIRVLDGRHKQVLARYFSASQVSVAGLPVADNFADDYSVIAWAKGYSQAGYFPVRVEAGQAREVDLMLVPERARFDFSQASWDKLQVDWPELWHILRAKAPSEEAARRRYEALERDQPESLACLLNIASALRAIRLPNGRDGLHYFAELVWDGSMARDRFFGYADVELLRQARLGSREGLFGKEASPGIFHPGAFTSFKQLQFGEANVQLTFHHDDQHVDFSDWHGHARCRHIKVEPDIDYYKDLLAHFFLEVVPNEVSGSLTDPKVVYQLRWIAGRQAGSDFAPPYTLVN